jgi:hypothetical protein
MTLMTAVSLILSFKNISWVIFGLGVHTLRNLLPMYDPEDRKKAMDPEAW